MCLKSFQNLLFLQNLYRLRALGISYIDPVVVNYRDDQVLPSAMEPLHAMVSQCHLCDLSKSRRQPMPGFGDTNADVMIVDAYVSMAEDESAGYYTGRSGTTLRKMIENVLQLDVENVYITHAVKCKPLGSQTPTASEWNSCKSYLFKQIELVRPKIVIPLGPDAYRLLSGDETAFEQVRGQKVECGSYTIIPLYHPNYLLRNPSLKQVAMNDLITIKSCL